MDEREGGVDGVSVNFCFVDSEIDGGVVDESTEQAEKTERLIFRGRPTNSVLSKGVKERGREGHGWWEGRVNKASERGRGWMLIVPCPAARRLPIGKILQFDYNFFRWPHTTARKNLKRFGGTAKLWQSRVRREVARLISELPMAF